MMTDRPVIRGARAVRRRTMAIVLAAVAVTALSGCSPERLGAAAVVDGRTISTDHLQDLAREYDAVVPGQPPGRVQLSVLQQLIVDEVFDAMSKDLGVRVRPGRVSAELDALVAQVGGRKALVRALSSQQRQVVPPSQLERWMRDRLLFEAIAREVTGASADAQPDFDVANRKLTEYAAGMDIEINPRYGAWNPDSGITPLVSGGLSKSVAELAGDGS